MIVWTVNNADVWNYYGKADVVDAIYWRCAWLEDGKEAAFQNGSTVIPYDPGARFEQFADLSEAALLAMAHKVMGGAVASVEHGIIRAATIRNETPPKIAERLIAEVQLKGRL
jgi:hypothetical protein